MSRVAQIALRPVETGDLPLFFEHQRDAIAVAMVGFQSRDRAAFDQHWAKILADQTSLIRTIVATFDQSQSDGMVAGNILSWNSEGKREIGYWIDRDLWGRGVATAALSAFLHLEQTRPLYADVAKHNVGSLRVLQKCGFTFPDSTSESADNSGDSFFVLMLAST